MLKIPPEILGSLEATKVNKEIWTVISLVVGTFDMILERLNYLVLKSISIISKLANKFYNSWFSSKYQVNLANILLNNEQYMSSYLETEL